VYVSIYCYFNPGFRVSTRRIIHFLFKVPELWFFEL
jgi:hypothetical protein